MLAVSLFKIKRFLGELMSNLVYGMVKRPSCLSVH